MSDIAKTWINFILMLQIAKRFSFPRGHKGLEATLGNFFCPGGFRGLVGALVGSCIESDVLLTEVSWFNDIIEHTVKDSESVSEGCHLNQVSKHYWAAALAD